MASSKLSLSILSVAAILAAASCKKEGATPAAPAQEDLLTGAIELQGGISALKSGSAYSARYKAEFLGIKIKGTVRYRAGAQRLKYSNGAGDTQIHQVAAEGKCWTQFDKVVIPCIAEARDRAAKRARLLEAAHFYPLKERKDRTVRAGAVDLDGRKFKTLTITADQELGTLLLDPDSYRVVGLKMQTTINGKQGELRGAFSKFEKNCGAAVPTKREYTFDGQLYLVEEVSGLICEKVDVSAFAEPKQVAHLSVDLRHTASVDLACYKLKGPLTGLPGALDKITALLKEQKITVEGPAHLVHRKGPPRVRNPAAWRTDVCYPVENKAWHAPKGTWKGEFKLFERMGDEFLRAFGVGDYAKNTPLLAATLTKEAKKMKRKQVSSMVQVLHMDPREYPASQRVSEMHLPMD